MAQDFPAPRFFLLDRNGGDSRKRISLGLWLPFVRLLSVGSGLAVCSG